MDRVHYLLDDQRRQLAHFFLQVDSVILAFLNSLLSHCGIVLSCLGDCLIHE